RRQRRRMSIRLERAQQAEVIASRLAQVKEQQEATEKELAALSEAMNALTAEPLERIETQLELEFGAASTVVETAHCLECRKKSIGWDNSWSHCPKCGAIVKLVTREGNPQKRIVREAVASALDEYTS